MNDAHISAQIETLQMALDRILNDCDKMQIELGRLKAGIGIHPVEPWQTEDVQPWEETGPICIYCAGDTGLWDGVWHCFGCGKPQPVNVYAARLTDDEVREISELIMARWLEDDE